MTLVSQSLVSHECMKRNLPREEQSWAKGEREAEEHSEMVPDFRQTGCVLL